MTPPRKVISRAPIVPDRVRRIGSEGFSFLPHSFLRGGFLASLGPHEPAFYLFLVLAGDRNGVSFYHYDSICSILKLPLDAYVAARNGLIERDLVAFDGTRFQVLSLPAQPVARPLTTPEELADHDPATIRAQILATLRSADDE